MGEREDYVLALPCFGAEARKIVQRRLKRKLGCVVNEEVSSTALPRNNLDGIEAPKSELKRELDCVVNKVESPPKNLDEIETPKIIENDSKRELGCVVNEVELSAISPPKNLVGVEIPKIIENDSKREIDCVVNEVESSATSPPKNLDGVEIPKIVEVGCVVNEVELPVISLQKSLEGVGIPNPMMVDNDLKREVCCVVNEAELSATSPQKSLEGVEIPMMVDNDLKREVCCVVNEAELSATSPQKSLEGVEIPMMVDNDLKREVCCVVNEAELSATSPQKSLDGVETPKIVENDSKRELGCVVNEEELSTTLPQKNLIAEAPKIVQNELKRELGCVVNEAELFATSPRKKLAIEAPITNFDDISSEVLDPITPKTIENAKENENVSSLEITPPELIGCSVNHDRVSFDETISEGSGNSSTLSCSDEVTRNRGSSGVSTSQVTLEIPEHASTTGIRKITFKFSKSKEEYESKSSVSGARVFSNGPHDGYSVINFNDELGLDDASNRCPYNMELKMSKKVIPDSYPTNVKKLLSTGILEGARVKYKTTSGEKEIPGKIRGCGYLCGCSICNFTNVLSAYEFEQHAGGAKTRHPNNHIFLENGRTIYSIIEELKTAPPGLLEELVTEMAGSSVNQESYRAWKEGLQQCSESAKRERKYQSKSSSISLTHLRFMSKCTEDEQRAFKRSVLPSKQMGKRPNDSSLFCSGSQKRSCDGGAKKRDNDLHRMLFLPNGLPDGTYLGYYAKGQKILDGYKHGSGIVCGHCEYEISPSQFEAHAGWAARRQPYRHIYTANGLTLHDLAISLSNGQTLATGNNDDMCTLCGDRGELIPCGSCPRAYHQTCLLLQNAPMGDWHCPNCIDRKGDVGSPNSSKPIIIRLTRVVKNPEIVCGGCVICRENDFSVDQFDDRTVIICDQCEKEYHVGCLRGAGRCDLKELPKDKWFCCNDCNRIYVALRNLVDRGSEAIPSFETFRINRKLLVKGLAKVADNDIQWRVLSGKCRHHEHLPLLSKAVSIFRECFSPIIAKAGRDLIPVMVHGRNISGQEFGGMYCVLLTVKSVVVSAGLLRIFGREMAELPLVATSKEYQGKGYFLALFSLIEKFLRDQKVENLVLPATEKAKFMWVNRLGFSDVSQERLSAYTREFQLTEFSGSIMLEKKVERVMDDFDVE